MTTPLSLGVAVGALVATGVLVALSWRRRDRPTAWPLFGFTAALLALVAVHVAVTYVGAVGSADPGVGHDGTSTAGTVAVSFGFLAAFGLWAVFAFEYTGRGSLATTAVRAIVGGIGLATATIFAISQTALVSVRVANAFYNAALVAVIVFAVVGVFLIVDESTRLGPLPRREALALAAAVGVLVPSPLLYFTTPGGLGLTGPVLASGVALVVTLRRGAPLTTLPATSVVGRDQVVTEMSDAVLVVGRDGTVRDANPAAERLLDADGGVVGTRWATLFPSAPGPARVAGPAAPIELERGDTVVAATASGVRDRQGRPLGHLVVCQDVTARRERERRLAVLSRFLVDTVSERTDDVVECATRLADGVPDPDRRRRLGDDAWTATTNLLELVEYARDIERALADADRRDSDVAAVLRGVVSEAPRATPRVQADPDARAAVAPSLLDSVLRLLVVEVLDAPASSCAVRTDGDEVVVTVDAATGDTTASTPVDSTPGTEGDDVVPRPGAAARLARLGLASVGATVTVRRETPAGAETTGPVRSVTVRLPASGRTVPTPRGTDPASAVGGASDGGDES